MSQNVMHPMLFVEDLGATIEWFAKLGFQTVMQLNCPDSGQPAHASFVREGITVMAGQKLPFMDIGPVSNALGLYFVEPGSPENLDKLCSDWKSEGISVVTEPQNQYWGHRTFEVCHPEGFSLTFAVIQEELTVEQMTENLKQLAAAAS